MLHVASTPALPLRLEEVVEFAFDQDMLVTETTAFDYLVGDQARCSTLLQIVPPPALS